MLDKHLLLEQPEIVRESIARRFKNPEIVDVLIDIHQFWKTAQHTFEDLNHQLKARSKEIRDVKAAGKDASQLVEEVKKLKETRVSCKQRVTNLWNNFRTILGTVGNIVHDTVPVSKDEQNNELVREWGTPRTGEFRHHHHLLRMIDGYSPEQGSKVVGHRGYYLKGPGMLLNMALANYGVRFLLERGYTAIQPPYFMLQSVMGKVAQLAQYDEELYHVSTQNEHGEHDDHYLIATSEQPLAAYHIDQQLHSKDLPIRYAGFSTCFRKEAGAYGKDTWGIFRVHQFDKVEQFCITTAEDSWPEHEKMLRVSEECLQELGIPYRVVNIVSGELNDAAAKKYDIEAWFPGYNEYREVVSCSNCTDYQSRTTNTRLDNGLYPHMLNSTLCACTRIICAILENFQTESGITVPPVLRNYLGGQTEIPYILRGPRVPRDPSTFLKK